MYRDPFPFPARELNWWDEHPGWNALRVLAIGFLFLFAVAIFAVGFREMFGIGSESLDCSSVDSPDYDACVERWEDAEYGRELR